MKLLIKIFMCTLLISCGESENKTSSSSKSSSSSKEGEPVDFIKYENGKTRLKVFFDGDEIIQNITKIEEFDVEGKLYHISEYNFDIGDKSYDFAPSLTKIYDPQGNEILKVKFFKENNTRKIESVKISNQFNEHITKFWDTDLNSFYKGYMVKEKIVKRFDNGDTKEIVRFIEYNNKKVPVERLLYNQIDDYDNNKKVNVIVKHQRLLGNIRRVRNHDKYNINNEVDSDLGIFSDDLKGINLKFQDEEIIVNVTFNDSKIDGVKAENMDTHFAFEWYYLGRVYYSVRNSENLISHLYNSNNEFNIGYEMKKTNRSFLGVDNITRFQFPDEFLDDSKLSMYDYHSKDKFTYDLYQEEQLNNITKGTINITRNVSVLDSFTKRSGCYLSDKVSKFYKSPTIMTRANEDNLMYKLYNLQDVQENQIFGEFFHPNGKKMAEVKVKFVEKLRYRRTDECSSKQYPRMHRIVTYYDDEGNQLGEAEFEWGSSYGGDHIVTYSNPYALISDDDISYADSYVSNFKQISGDYFSFFYEYDDFMDQSYRKDLKNPVVFKVQQTSNTRKETKYKTESKYFIDYPDSQFDKRYDHSAFVEGSLFLEKETSYVKFKKWDKDGKEIIYGDKGVVIEENDWKKGEKSDF